MSSNSSDRHATAARAPAPACLVRAIRTRVALVAMPAMVAMVTMVTTAAMVATAAMRPAAAGEATARGRKADITWIDEKGETQTASARLIRYNYWNRIYLSSPRGGKNYKDEAHEEAGFPLAGNFVKLTQLDRVDFEWKSDPASGLSRLEITFKLADGKVTTGTGASLAGASHPLSPWLSFTVDGAPHRIDLDPMSSEADRAGRARLVSIQVVL